MSQVDVRKDRSDFTPNLEEFRVTSSSVLPRHECHDVPESEADSTPTTNPTYIGG